MKDNLNKMRTRLAENAVNIVGEAVGTFNSPRVSGAWNLIKAILAMPEGKAAAHAYFVARSGGGLDENGAAINRV